MYFLHEKGGWRNMDSVMYMMMHEHMFACVCNSVARSLTLDLWVI